MQDASLTDPHLLGERTEYSLCWLTSTQWEQDTPRLTELLWFVVQVTASLPSPYRSEMAGIADASGMTIDEVTIYNIFYELFTLCTSVVVQDSQGNLHHGRNLDFGLFLG